MTLIPLDSGSQSVTSTPGSVSSNSNPLTFSYPGAVVAATASPRWYTDLNVTFTKIRLSAATVPTSNLSIAVNHNGALATTVTLGASTNTVEVVFTITMVPNDWLDVSVVAAGAASNISLELTP